MKLLVFAHTPPPHHGQSYMVQLMLEGLGGDCRKRSSGARPEANSRGIECYHVNTRVSKGLQDIGDFRFGKLLLLFWYCLEAIWCRFRYGVDNFYFIPAPGKWTALYRDWLVMFLCRPFFKRFVLHWHASGLGHWLETTAVMRTRSVTYTLAKKADLSIVLSEYGRADAEKFYPRNIAVVGNGIPDPCVDFEQKVLPRRRARLAARRLLQAGKPVPAEVAADAGRGASTFTVLFMAHCTREKGLFDAIEGVLLAQRQLAERRSPVSLRLVIAGQFATEAEERAFDESLNGPGRGVLEYAGFISGEQKRRWFEEADGFCFPSHIESFGLVLAEAMAFGLPVVATRCGAMPEVMSPDYPGLVDPHQLAQIGQALVELISFDGFERLRRRFESRYTVERHLDQLAAALRWVDNSAPRANLTTPIAKAGAVLT